LLALGGEDARAGWLPVTCAWSVPRAEASWRTRVDGRSRLLLRAGLRRPGTGNRLRDHLAFHAQACDSRRSSDTLPRWPVSPLLQAPDPGSPAASPGGLGSVEWGRDPEARMRTAIAAASTCRFVDIGVPGCSTCDAKTAPTTVARSPPANRRRPPEINSQSRIPQRRHPTAGPPERRPPVPEPCTPPDPDACEAVQRTRRSQDTHIR